MPEYAYGMTNSSFSYTLTSEEMEAMRIPMQPAKCLAGIILDTKPKRIIRSGPCTIVFWRDGTKTIVRKAPDEEDNAYAAFTAALAIKIFGSNQAVKRIVEMTETQEKKKKREPDPIVDPIVKAYTQDLVNLAEYILEKKEDGV